MEYSPNASMSAASSKMKYILYLPQWMQLGAHWKMVSTWLNECSSSTLKNVLYLPWWMQLQTHRGSLISLTNEPAWFQTLPKPMNIHSCPPFDVANMYTMHKMEAATIPDIFAVQESYFCCASAIRKMKTNNSLGTLLSVKWHLCHISSYYEWQNSSLSGWQITAISPMES